MNILIVHDCILAFLLFIVLAIVFECSLKVSVIYMGIFSFFMALLFVLLNAPDVGLTEASVGSGLSTVLLLLSIKYDKNAILGFNRVACIMMVISVIILCSVLYTFPDFGSSQLPANDQLINSYVEASSKNMGSINMVTAVLANFRAYDTLGETFVIFTAAIAVLLILSGNKKDV